MRKKGMALIGCGIFSLVTGLLPFNVRETLFSPQLSAQVMRTPNREYIITIQGQWSNNNLITKLDPREVRVGRGDPVTWINESRVGVKMRFGNGSQCRKVSVKALGWKLEPDKCYETEDTLKTGDSTTIRFWEIGLFNYEIEYGDKNRREKGVVHVQSENR